MKSVSISVKNNKEIINLHSTAVVILFFAALAGQFSVSRINLAFERWGILGEPRILLTALLFVLIWPMLIQLKRRSTYDDTNKYLGSWFLFVILFHLYLIISYYWTSGSDYSQEIVMSLVLLIIMLSLAYLLIRLDADRTISIFLYSFFIAAMIYAVGGLLLKGIGGGRIAFLWGGPNVYVRIIGTGIIVALYLWVKTEKKVWLASIPILLIAAIMAGSRGGLSSLIIILVLSLFLLIKKISKILIVFILTALFILVVLYAPVTSPLRRFIENRYPIGITDINTEYERTRGVLYSNSWELFKSEPLIGVGIGEFSDYGYKYPHNILLNVAAEGGMLGLLFLALIFMPIFRRWYRDRSIENNVCFIIAAFYLGTSMVSGSYYDWRFIWLFLLFYMAPLTDTLKVKSKSKAGILFPSDKVLEKCATIRNDTAAVAKSSELKSMQERA